MRLFNRFLPGLALRLIKASWLNKVANYWNFARGGHCIDWTIPENPTQDNGPRVDLNMDMLDGELLIRGFLKEDTILNVARNVLPGDEVAPEDWNTQAGTGYGDAQTQTVGDTTITTYTACGTSKKAAAADHRHKSNLAPKGDDLTYGGRPLAGWTLSNNSITSEGETGTSKYSARADHTHPGVAADDVPYDLQYSVGDALDAILDITDELDTRVSTLENALENASGACDCQEYWDDYADWAEGVDEDIGDIADILGDIAVDVNGTAKVPLSAIQEAVVTSNNTSKLPITYITGAGMTNGTGTAHSGNCLIYIDGNGDLAHSGNSAYDIISDLVSKTTVTNHVVTEYPFPEWATGATKANVLIGTDQNGNIENVATLPTSNVSSDKVLTARSGGTALSWEDGLVAPSTADGSNDRIPVVEKGGTAVSWKEYHEYPDALGVGAGTIGGYNTAAPGGTFSAGRNSSGAVVWLPTRMSTVGGNTVGVGWRQFSISKDGRIISIGGETMGPSLYPA